MTRTQRTIERAGRINRAQDYLDALRVNARKAYEDLIETDPETAAIVAKVIMENEAALKRLASL